MCGQKNTVPPTVEADGVVEIQRECCLNQSANGMYKNTQNNLKIHVEKKSDSARVIAETTGPAATLTRIPEEQKQETNIQPTT